VCSGFGFGLGLGAACPGNLTKHTNDASSQQRAAQQLDAGSATRAQCARPPATAAAPACGGGGDGGGGGGRGGGGGWGGGGGGGGGGGSGERSGVGAAEKPVASPQ